MTRRWADERADRKECERALAKARLAHSPAQNKRLVRMPEPATPGKPPPTPGREIEFPSMARRLSQLGAGARSNHEENEGAHVQSHQEHLLRLDRL